MEYVKGYFERMKAIESVGKDLIKATEESKKAMEAIGKELLESIRIPIEIDKFESTMIEDVIDGAAFDDNIELIEFLISEYLLNKEVLAYIVSRGYFKEVFSIIINRDDLERFEYLLKSNHREPSQDKWIEEFLKNTIYTSFDAIEIFNDFVGEERVKKHEAVVAR